MKFRNKITGLVVDIPSIAKGDWEPLEVPSPKAVIKEEKVVENKSQVKKTTRKVSK